MLQIRQKVNNRDHCDSGKLSYFVPSLPEGWTVTWEVVPVTDGDPVPTLEVSGVGDSEVDVDVSGLEGEYAYMLNAQACVIQEPAVA